MTTPQTYPAEAKRLMAEMKKLPVGSPEWTRLAERTEIALGLNPADAIRPASDHPRKEAG